MAAVSWSRPRSAMATTIGGSPSSTALTRAPARCGASRRPKTQLNQPRVSPDGRTVAFIGGLMSDFGSIGGDVYTVPIIGGEPVDRTPAYRGTFTSLLWGRAGLVGSALIGDRSAIVPFTAISPVQPIWSAPVRSPPGAPGWRFPTTARSSDS